MKTEKDWVFSSWSRQGDLTANFLLPFPENLNTEEPSSIWGLFLRQGSSSRCKPNSFMCCALAGGRHMESIRLYALLLYCQQECPPICFASSRVHSRFKFLYGFPSYRFCAFSSPTQNPSPLKQWPQYSKERTWWAFLRRQKWQEPFAECQSAKNKLNKEISTIGWLGELFEEVEEGEGDEVIFGCGNFIIADFRIRVVRDDVPVKEFGVVRFFVEDALAESFLLDIGVLH